MKAQLTLFIVVLFGISMSLDNEYKIELPEHFPLPEYDFTQNKITEQRIRLGRALFYDPILSLDSTISCAFCHSSYNAFAHTDHDLSHGISDSIGTRNAPSLVNLAWSKNFMWDGAILHLDMQALAPIEHKAEMGENFENVIRKLNQSELYKTLFYEAYNDSLATGEHFLKALSQFQLSLISANSKYDRVIKGEDGFSVQEELGYEIYKDKCASCHQEPLFTNGSFENNGLAIDTHLNDFGRVNITQNPKDSFLFKVPTLRNLEYTYPYMHDGRFENLNEVLNHYQNGIFESETLSKELKQGIKLNSNEQVELMSFLLCLTDKEFVFNPQHQFPKEILFNKANTKN